MAPVICIPARINSTRLPRKLLKDIGGKPMIRHVAESAVKAAKKAGNLPIFIAADDRDIVRSVSDIEGVSCEFVPGAYQSGSDRIYALLQQIDPRRHFDTIINLQGDMPFFSETLILEVLQSLQGNKADLGTLVYPLCVSSLKTFSKVKVACAFRKQQRNARALYFSRNPLPYGKGSFWGHVGIYAWRRSALERFVHSPPGLLEKRESLEQLRLLELGMEIRCRKISKAPISVDVPKDLALVREIFEKKLK